MKTIMSGKYQIDVSKEGILGEGSFCICRKGLDVETGEDVAIKKYKFNSPNSKDAKESLLKLRRLVTVLQKLHEPFQQPADPKLWNSQLDRVKPDKLFMGLIDYSKDESGQPGFDPADGQLYVVSELAQQSLKDYVAQRKAKVTRPSKETVRSITKAILLVMAGLHAKGFVHLDMKPENLMIFNGRLKLIDVDGCVEIGKSISLDDSTVSFSPCYCAPEWANFVLGNDTKRISAAPDLDTWSVGCTICELVTMDAILLPICNSFSRNYGRRSGRAHFMDWLAHVQKSPVPRAVEEFDDELVELMTKSLLVCSQSERRTCAEALDESYLASHEVIRTPSSPISVQCFEDDLTGDETASM
jgi:serine/threonine protein kinase